MHIVVLRLSALGDVLTASPVAAVLRRTWPEARLTWVVEERCAGCLRSNPYLDEVIALPSSRQWRLWFRSDRRRLLREMRSVRSHLHDLTADVVFDIHGLAKTAWLARAIRAPRKVRPADATERIPLVYNEQAQRHPRSDYITSLYVSLTEHLGCQPQAPQDYEMHLPVGSDDRAWALAWLQERGLQPGKFMLCAPGTTWPQKHWLSERWAPTLERLTAETSWPAVLIGGPAEAALAQRISDRLPTPHHLAIGGSTIGQSGALMEAGALTLTVDTGPMHMAVAVGCPTVAIYGPTPPRWFGPQAAYKPVYASLACSPCYRRPTCDGRLDCQSAVSVDQVVEASLDLIGQTR